MLEFRPWILTAEQAENIINNDLTAYNTFFNDNIDRFKKYAKSYLWKTHGSRLNYMQTFYDPDDMVAQLYIDLKHCDFRSGAFLNYFVRMSFKCFSYGGYDYLVSGGRSQGNAIWAGFFFNFLSLDEPIRSSSKRDDKPQYIQDFVSDYFWERYTADNTEVLLSIVSKYLPPREYQIFSLYLLGYPTWRIKELIGTFYHLRYMQSARVHLYNNWETLYNDLLASDINVNYNIDLIASDIKEYVDKKIAANKRNAAIAQAKRLANKELANEKRRAYAKANAEKMKEYNKAKYEKHKEKILARNCAKYHANKNQTISMPLSPYGLENTQTQEGCRGV